MKNQISFKGKAHELMTYLYQLVKEENRIEFQKTLQTSNVKKIIFNFTGDYTVTYEMGLN